MNSCGDLAVSCDRHFIIIINELLRNRESKVRSDRSAWLVVHERIPIRSDIINNGEQRRELSESSAIRKRDVRESAGSDAIEVTLRSRNRRWKRIGRPVRQSVGVGNAEVIAAGAEDGGNASGSHGVSGSPTGSGR